MRACLAELLRTAHHPRSLLLRVEQIVPQRIPGDKTCGDKTRGDKTRGDGSSSKATRLYLTDGELVIQALTAPELQLCLNPGDILDIRRFEVLRARRKTTAGQTLFLGIQDCEVLPGENSAANASSEQGGFIVERSPLPPAPVTNTRKRRYSEITRGQSPTPPPSSQQPMAKLTTPQPGEGQTLSKMEPSGSQSEDDFETSIADAVATQRRRQALREIDGNMSPHFSDSISKSPAPPRLEAVPAITGPILTPLASLSSLAPSTAVNVLVIFTWTGQTLLRPSRAFPPKRHLKLHDPSISHLFSGVSLAAYVDAHNFKPERGTIALLQDVVVQRCGSGGGEVSQSHMLNAYSNVPGKLEEKGVTQPWFIDDEQTLKSMGLGPEIDDMRVWWERRESKRMGGATLAS